MCTKELEVGDNDEAAIGPSVFELNNDKKNSILMQAPKSLGLQFFRDCRYLRRSNLARDRWTARTSIGVVIAARVYLPFALIALAFALFGVRWAWFGFQLYLLIANIFLLS